MRGFWARFRRDEEAAVAATYALMLVPIVTMAGVAYDFTQMAALDTELQNAADQAALAAASQLSKTATAMDEAESAASNLVGNQTLLAADGTSTAVGVQSVTFYASKADAEAGTNGFTDRAKSADARFVQVSVVPRQAKFTLTPIAGLIWSPSLNANAVAGMGTAICRVPPIMICNPAEGTDNEFDDGYIGKGLKLTSVGGGGGAWAPGNFGYLNVNGGDSGNPLLALKKALGWNTPPGDCIQETGINTKPGANTPVTHALNTRFDIFENGGPGGDACPAGGSCAASLNSVKDLYRSPTASKCDIGNQGWELPSTAEAYLPDPTTRLPLSTPKMMGHPRDICHAVSSDGDCAKGKIGDAVWDRTNYFAVNYPGFNWQAAMTAAYGTTTVTRHQVYRWEVSHRDDTYINSATGTATTIKANRTAVTSPNKLDHNEPICAASSINPVTDTTDRRTFPVAIVNCTAESVNGNSTGVKVLRWMNVFLVEPSANRTRTQQQDIYVEVVSVNELGNSDGGAAQVVRRDKPYLVR